MGGRVFADLARIQEINVACRKRFNVTDEELNSRQRSDAAMAWARQVRDYLMVKELGVTLSQAARAAGRHHSTVLYSVHKVEDAMECYPEIATQIANLRAGLTPAPCR